MNQTIKKVKLVVLVLERFNVRKFGSKQLNTIHYHVFLLRYYKKLLLIEVIISENGVNLLTLKKNLIQTFMSRKGRFLRFY